MRLVVVTPPTAEPVSLAEAKAHLRVDSSDENSLISALIASARQWVEAYTNRSLGLQTLELQLPCFASVIELPRPPLRTLVSVKYLDSSNVEQTLSVGSYYRTVEHSDGQPGFLELLENVTLPTTYSSRVAVKVRYQAGYDTSGSPGDIVPEAIKQAMLILIAEMYEYREITVTGSIVQENKVIPALLSVHKVWSL